jgi:DNA-binding MarR family transcriptional regulator
MGILSDLLKEIPLSAVLREKIATFEQEIAALKEENAILKDDNRQLQTENKRLKDEIESFTHPVDLHETEKKILIYLADSNSLNFNDSMVENLNLDQTRLHYFLETLRERNYITLLNGAVFGVASKYALTQKGREFLIKNNLV